MCRFFPSHLWRLGSDLDLCNAIIMNTGCRYLHFLCLAIFSIYSIYWTCSNINNYENYQIILSYWQSTVGLENVRVISMNIWFILKFHVSRMTPKFLPSCRWQNHPSVPFRHTVIFLWFLCIWLKKLYASISNVIFFLAFKDYFCTWQERLLVFEKITF